MPHRPPRKFSSALRIKRDPARKAPMARAAKTLFKGITGGRTWTDFATAQARQIRALAALRTEKKAAETE